MWQVINIKFKHIIYNILRTTQYLLYIVYEQFHRFIDWNELIFTMSYESIFHSYSMLYLMEWNKIRRDGSCDDTERKAI